MGKIVKIDVYTVLAGSQQRAIKISGEDLEIRVLPCGAVVIYNYMLDLIVAAYPAGTIAFLSQDSGLVTYG